MSKIKFIIFLLVSASAISITSHFKGENASIISQIEQMKLKKSVSNVFILTGHQDTRKMNEFFKNLHDTNPMDVFFEDNIALDYRSVYYTMLCQLVYHKDVKCSANKYHDLIEASSQVLMQTIRPVARRNQMI